MKVRGRRSIGRRGGVGMGEQGEDALGMAAVLVLVGRKCLGGRLSL